MVESSINTSHTGFVRFDNAVDVGNLDALLSSCQPRLSVLLFMHTLASLTPVGHADQTANANRSQLSHRTGTEPLMQPRILVNADMAICLALSVTGIFNSAVSAQPATATDVAAFLPDNYVTDGSVCYQPQIQEAIDSVGASGGELVFPSVKLRICYPAGLVLRSNLTLRMDGATFLLDEQCNTDGQLFFGRNVCNVQFQGGIDHWA